MIAGQLAALTASARPAAAPPPSYTGPLDIAAGGVAAYGQRALSAAKLGTAVYTIREAGGNTTQSFNSDAVTGAVDAAAITAFLNGANGFVTTWNDQSGSARNGVQATTAQQPSWVAAASPLTLPGVGATGAGAGPLLVTSANVPLTGSFSIFAVLVPTTVTSSGSSGPLVACNYATGGATAYALANFAGGGNAQLDCFNVAGVSAEVGGFATITINANTAYLVDMHAILGANAMFVNGADQGANNANDGLNAPSVDLPMGLFCLNDDVTNTRGYGLELIVFSPAVTDPAIRLALRQNIAAYYGIVLGP